jgi:hypothetical protein
VVEAEVVVAAEEDQLLSLQPDVRARLPLEVVVVGLIFQAALGKRVVDATLDHNIPLFLF